MTNPELTARQQMILSLVIREFVNQADPISSRTLLELYDLGVSSATVRNEMAYLEELGYLTHPHTSAGRIPTEEGYRLFVGSILGEARLPLTEQRMIRHQFHQVGVEVRQWMRLAASTLARASHSASLVTAPVAEQVRFKHLELISARDQLVLMVLVTEGGNVEQQMINLAEPLPQEELSQAADRLNELCTGLGASQIQGRINSLPTFEAEVGKLAVEMMEQAGELSGDVYRDGLSEVLSQPEFVDTESSQGILKLFEEKSFLQQLLTEALSPTVGNVQVLIGGEERWQELTGCSMVLARYGVPGFATGALGVLGPTRLPYSRAISTVRYVSDLMSDLVYELYVE